MRIVLTTTVLFCTLLSFSQDLQRSKLIDSIQVKEANGETFALYLPQKYDETKLSAIVFIFEPMGRGKIGIQPFIEAAEKYNYVLVCSNNTRNGPYDINFNVTNRLFAHIFSTFSIDEKQIYTAGFSGGSRLASAIAVMTNAIQGVIGCGAGFTINQSQLPNFNSTFSYVGLVGNRDMNYQEMFRVQDWLNRFSIPSEIITYDDNHRWPPSKQILRAFDWLQLQAYLNGIRPKDAAVVEAAFKQNYRLADSLLTAGEQVLAVKEYDRILKNYQRHFTLDTLAEKVRQLKKQKTYKKELRVESSIVDLERDISTKFSDRFKEEIILGKSKDDFKWWKKEIAKFDKAYMNNEDTHLKKMGERLRYQLYALAVESSEMYLRAGNHERALYCNQLLELQLPDRPYPHFRLAQLYAQMKDVDNLVKHLQKAISFGFTDKVRLRNTKEFAPFLDNERVKALLN